MNNKLSKDKVLNLIQTNDISLLSLDEIKFLFLKEDQLKKFSPDGEFQIDPRNNDRIVYNSARSKRPHDNQPDNSLFNPMEKACVICEGKTTNIVDYADLSEGFTFINKNLFPIFYPSSNGLSSNDNIVYGYHFLQWTSSFHNKDWHNMSVDDNLIVMKRLAALEKKLIEDQNNHLLIIKNYGRLVGGSLVHGHQQIGVSNILPNRIYQDLAFEKQHSESYARYILNKTPEDLIIKEYEHALLITPYFMRRPFDMQLVLKDPHVSFIYQLNEHQLESIVRGWHDAIKIMLNIMPKIGREPAYNVVTHNGFGNALYFEFLPYTQEIGGFEQLGLFSCQGNPYQSAKDAKELISSI